MRTAACFVLAAVIVATAGLTTVPAQPGAKKLSENKPAEIFRQFRSLMSEGRYDVAAGTLQAFVDSLNADPNPDAVVLELENRYGSTVFQQLRGVPKWSDDPTTEKQARANIETLVARQKATVDKLIRTPERVGKYIQNLGASPEERVFAELELKKTGNYAVPFLVEALRQDTDPAISTGILMGLANFDPPTMGGWLAALDGLKPVQQHLVLRAVATRPDALILHNNAQSDFVPWLWRVMAQTEGVKPEPTTRLFAKSILSTLGENPDKTDPRAALTAIARSFYDRKARFSGAKTNADGSPATVPVWVWDPAANKLQEPLEVPVGQAEEHFGLKYARWALEKDPSYAPAQHLIVALVAERAAERAKLGDLAKLEPAAYALLASAPTEVLHDLLDQGLNQKRTAQVLALTQALGDRADKTAAGPRPAPAGAAPGLRPSLFARGLEYPDPRVQLAAANALLRSPIPVDPKVRGRIVEILRRAAAADAGVPGTARGKALVADPNRQRADSSVVILRGLGYDVEYFATGRELLRRVAKASDFDLILVDHHLVNPTLEDVVASLRADLNAASRPVLVVASTDKPLPPSFDMLLLRLALLIAATESDPMTMPPPFVPNLDTPPEQVEALRKSTQERRDNVFRTVAANRIARLLRVVDTSGIEPSPAQRAKIEMRAEQVTLAVLAAEFPLTPESSPATAARFADLQRRAAIQPPVVDYAGAGIQELMGRIERLEVDVARVPVVQKRYDDFRLRVDPVGLGLTVRSTRDPEVEAKVSRQVRGFAGVRVIPEPYTRVGFDQDVRAAFADDPAAAPRDQAEKKAGARLAVEWLRKMATGELAGYDVRSAEPELRAAVMVDDLAEPAIEALSRFPSGEVQQDLIRAAIAGRSVPARLAAADAAIRHIQAYGRLAPADMGNMAGMSAANEANPDLRGKLLVIKGLLAQDGGDYAAELRNYRPPLAPPPKEMAEEKPKDKEPEKKEPDKKEPDQADPKARDGKNP